MNSKRFWLVLCIGALVLVALWLSWKDDDHSAAAAAKPRAHAEDPSPDTAPMLSAGAARADAVPVNEPAQPAADSPDAGVPLFQPKLFTADELRRRTFEREELNARWHGQTEDRAWTSETRDRIGSVILRADLSVQSVREVDCRNTICRMSLHAFTSAYTEVDELIRAARSLERETWLMPSPSPTKDGSWDIEVYLAKKGFKLSGGGGPIPHGSGR